jgi:hypothetical protein
MKPEDFGVVDKPQSDLEKFIELYKSVGIELEPIVNERDNTKCLNVVTTPKLSEHKSSTHICFDMNGKFIQQGIWE